MKARMIGLASVRDRTMVVAAICAAGLAFAGAFIDVLTWIELDLAAIYGLPLVLAALTRSRRLLWSLTALLTMTTFVVYAIQIPAGAFALGETFFVNRVLDAVAVLLTAGLLHVWIMSVEKMAAQGRLLSAAARQVRCGRIEGRAPGKRPPCGAINSRRTPLSA